MEGPVKERLTGALILVAALVIVVPEMLSGPDAKPARNEAAPAQPADAGPPMRTYSLALDSAADTRPAEQATLTPQSTNPPDAESAKLPAAEQPAAPTAPDPAPVATAPDSAPAAPIVESPKPAASAAEVSSRWWTQLGSFSSRDNAQKLAQQLRAAGFPMDVSKIRAGGKELFRVRAGPVSERGEAVALQARLAAAGHKSTLVAP